MLVSLAILYNFAPDVYTEYIAKIICQILHYSIEQQHDKIFNIYVMMTGYVLQQINIHWFQGK